MAGSLTTLGTATGNAAATSLAATGITAAVGDYLVATAGVFSATAFTFTDSAGNTWTVRTPNASAKQAIATCRVTNALAAGSVTASFGAPNASQVARTLEVFRANGVLTASDPFDVAAAAASGAVAAWASAALPALAQANSLLVAACSCDTNAATSSTPAAGWTESTGADITNGGAFQLVTEYRSVTSGASGQTGGGTWGSSGWAWNAQIIALKETVAAGAAPRLLGSLGAGT